MYKKILLLGEPMGLFMAEETGPLRKVGRFSASVAGAEFNVAVGLARLGHTPVYGTALGEDPLGGRILDSMRANGIDTALVQIKKDAQTGFMLKGSTQEGDPEIAYYRKGSAASKLGPDDVDRLDLSGIDWVHVTGVFPAVSDSAHRAAVRLMERAGERAIPISFDPNLRPQLWPGQKEMVRALNEMAGLGLELILPGEAEGRILAGLEGEKEIARFYHGMGVKNVLVKLGSRGAYYASQDGDSGYVDGFPVERLVDTVGAGDGFAAGAVSALCEGLPLKEAARRGCAIGATQVANKSDNEGLPTREQLEAVLTAGKVAAYENIG